ncbi:MAG: hypothetical protein ACK2UJ_11920 [Candidatus Promineifilaceae bacterium]
MLDQLENWLTELFQPQGDVLALAIQVLILAMILLITPLIARFLGRYFDRLMERLAQFERMRQKPAYEEQFSTLRGVIRPLTAWVLARVGIVVLDQVGRPSSLLLWLSGFLLIWLVYRLLHAVLTLVIPLDTAQKLTRRVIRPVAIILVLIQSTGLLDEYFGLGFNVQTARITLGAIIAALAVFVLAIVLSRGTRSYLQNTFLPGAGMDASLSAVLATLASYVLLVAGVLAAHRGRFRHDRPGRHPRRFIRRPGLRPARRDHQLLQRLYPALRTLGGARRHDRHG